jgi:hypothetical protein
MTKPYLWSQGCSVQGGYTVFSKNDTINPIPHGFIDVVRYVHIMYITLKLTAPLQIAFCSSHAKVFPRHHPYVYKPSIIQICKLFCTICMYSYCLYDNNLNFHQRLFLMLLNFP